MEASPQARSAVRAVKNMRQWGSYMAIQYMANQHVPPIMFAVVLAFEFRRKYAR